MSSGVERARGPASYAKSRLPDGRQLGPACTDRGRPAVGYFTKRTAEGWLRRTLRYIEHDRGRKPSTVAGYKVVVRSKLLPAFGELPLEGVTTTMIERWLGSIELSASTRTKAIVHLPPREEGLGPAGQSGRGGGEAAFEPDGDIDVFSPEEVHGLVRAAAGEQDAAPFLTAAFTGLRRGELLALRWRDVDFAGSTIRVRAT